VLLDYPAGNLPVRDFKKADLYDEMADSKPIGSWDEANRALCTSSCPVSPSSFAILI